MSKSLLYHIQKQSPFLIFIDGSRTNTKSGGSWIISLEGGTIITSGWKPGFDRTFDIHSYHSEIYASLACLFFLGYYCGCYSFLYLTLLKCSMIINHVCRNLVSYLRIRIVQYLCTKLKNTKLASFRCYSNEIYAIQFKQTPRRYQRLRRLNNS